MKLQNTGIVGQYENVVTPNKKNRTDENEGDFFSTNVVVDTENSEWNIVDYNNQGDMQQNGLAEVSSEDAFGLTPKGGDARYRRAISFCYQDKQEQLDELSKQLLQNSRRKHVMTRITIRDFNIIKPISKGALAKFIWFRRKNWRFVCC